MLSIEKSSITISALMHAFLRRVYEALISQSSFKSRFFAESDDADQLIGQLRRPWNFYPRTHRSPEIKHGLFLRFIALADRIQIRYEIAPRHENNFIGRD